MRLGVIGNPIAQSPSPAMFGLALAAAGINATYEAWRVEADELASYVEQVRRDEIHGFNITIPHKQAVIPYLDDLTTAAKKIGAVNTVYHKNGLAIGHNTDGDGYLQSLRETHSPDLKSTRAVLLGAGGAALAIAHVLCANGLKRLQVVGRDFTRVEALVRGLSQTYDTSVVAGYPWPEMGPLMANTDLLIQTTPLGMKGKQDWLDLDFLKLLSESAIVSDIVANPMETRFLREAKKLGRAVLPGWGMLLYQGVAAFEVFTGKKPDVNIMREALVKALS